MREHQEHLYYLARRIRRTKRKKGKLIHELYQAMDKYFSIFDYYTFADLGLDYMLGITCDTWYEYHPAFRFIVPRLKENALTTERLERKYQLTLETLLQVKNGQLVLPFYSE